jgi:hypothetical protein
MENQQALYHAVGKTPGDIFPLHFSADSSLATGVVNGQVEGFYRSTHDGIQVQYAELAHKTLRAHADLAPGTRLSQVFARGNQGLSSARKSLQEDHLQRCLPTLWYL